MIIAGDLWIQLLGQPVKVPGSSAPFASHSFTCPLSELIPPGASVKVLSSALHMHFSGEYIRTEVLDPNNSPKASCKIEFCNGQDMNEVVEVPNRPELTHGDRLRTTCTFDLLNKAHGKDRIWGFAADDEMCMDWVMFYSENNTVTAAIEAAGATCHSKDHRQKSVRLRSELGIKLGEASCSRDTMIRAESDVTAEHVQQGQNGTISGSAALSLTCGGALLVFTYALAVIHLAGLD